VFDRAALLDRLLGYEDLVQTVLTGFLDDLPRQLEAMQGYFDAKDAQGIQRQAHTIKGAAANVGGEALAALAFELEKAGQAGDLTTVEAGIVELTTQFEWLKAAIVSTTPKGYK